MKSGNFKGSRPLGVYHPLGDPLAIEMSRLFKQVDILHQDGTWVSRGYAVLVVVTRSTEIVRQDLFLFRHVDLLSTTFILLIDLYAWHPVEARFVRGNGNVFGDRPGDPILRVRLHDERPVVAATAGRGFFPLIPIRPKHPYRHLLDGHPGVNRLPRYCHLPCPSPITRR